MSLTAVEVSQFNFLQLLPCQLSWPCTRCGTNEGRLQRSKVLHPGSAAVALQSVPSQTPVHRWLAVLNKSDPRSNNCELLFICCMRIRLLASFPGSCSSILLLAVWKIDSVCNRNGMSLGMRLLQHQSSTHKLASDLRCLRAVSGIVCSWLSPRNLGKEERREKADLWGCMVQFRSTPQ